ncbi:MAG: hypothetical protein R3A10_04425 [Caldilineaceae bacterium]
MVTKEIDGPDRGRGGEDENGQQKSMLCPAVKMFGHGRIAEPAGMARREAAAVEKESAKEVEPVA